MEYAPRSIGIGMIVWYFQSVRRERRIPVKRGFEPQEADNIGKNPASVGE
jgi:hypothetical protein